MHFTKAEISDLLPLSPLATLNMRWAFSWKRIAVFEKEFHYLVGVVRLGLYQ